MEVSAGLVPSEGSKGRICSRPDSLACRQPKSHLHDFLPVCVGGGGGCMFVCVYLQVSPFYKDTSRIGLRPSPVTLF